MESKNMFLDFINALGLIFGPIMLLAIIFSVALCVRAARRAASRPAARSAMIGALMPLAVGILAGLAALVILNFTQIQWRYIIKNCLVGLTFTSVPLIWSLLMLRARRASA
jgi:hypothetical protein